MKIAIVAAVASSLAIGIHAAVGGPPPIAAKSVYVVRPDPRECPSPLCGGYWASLANHGRTRCSDGFLRPRCYVAEASDARTRESMSIPADALVRAALGAESFENLGRLGILTVTDSWAPVGRAPATGGFFRLRDTGVRCVRAPCFSVRVGRLNTGGRTTLVSTLDLGPARSGPARRSAEAALASAAGLLAAGRVVPTSDGGRLFRATQVYVRGSQPRA